MTDDFEVARFALHPLTGARAIRNDDGRWYSEGAISIIGTDGSDADMAEWNWKPVREATHMEAIQDWWDSAEKSGRCNSGDTTILKWSESGFTIRVAHSSGSLAKDERILQRAPREPWADLAEVFNSIGFGADMDVEEAAEIAYKEGVRVTGGNDQ